ncbi:saccharopine dehydrogenase NADP-binding domain-containing protein [Maribacter antarcticus]|uniref:saccharopine dehydrogenase NADP-binding domain-containing protein n=1 Tax=Maribacter antarcticus TaxID=505250 RepID=UPI00047965DD|nr:saccharopine dehydrogenase NADP-binding domain-containing protein [Maribacter antarcticus]
MSTTILIIGGTGLIGKTIHNMLSKRDSQLKILIGTRKKDSIPNHIQLDVNDFESFESLKKHAITIIIVCTKDANNHVMNYAIKHKIDYTDITKPSNELLKAHESIKNNLIDSKIVFSSGWMGGIAPSLLYSTGVLAKDIQSVKMMVYYSTKDKAGSSSADFMAHNVSKPFFFYQNNLAKKTKHFLDGEDTKFDFDNQKRTVSDFDIPDLYIFNQIEHIPNVRAKMIFDSKIVTAILPFMQKIGFFKMLNFREKKWIFGGSGNGDISSFEIIYTDNGSKEKKIVLKCEAGQSELTAFSTVLHVEKMLENSSQKGIYFSHQLHEPKKFIDALTSNKSIVVH